MPGRFVAPLRVQGWRSKLSIKAARRSADAHIRDVIWKVRKLADVGIRAPICGRFMVSMLENGVALSMNRRICRQVLECGDGVREVTALALTTFKIPMRAADTYSPIQSGDSEDSVAALQDADALTAAPFRFMAPMRVRSWRSRLPMNLNVLPASCLQK